MAPDGPGLSGVVQESPELLHGMGLQPSGASRHIQARWVFWPFCQFLHHMLLEGLEPGVCSEASASIAQQGFALALGQGVAKSDAKNAPKNAGGPEGASVRKALCKDCWKVGMLF